MRRERAGNLDAPAHELEDALADGEAEGGALRGAQRRGGLLERLEDPCERARRDPDAGVGHLETDGGDAAAGAPTPTRNVTPPLSVNFSALPSRLISTCASAVASARTKVTAGHLGWADMIFCVERKHADRLHERFLGEIAGKRLIVLRIPDDYHFMDPAPIDLLRAQLAAHLEL